MVRSSGEKLGFVFDDGEKRQIDTLAGASLESAIAREDLEIRPKGSRMLDALGLACYVMAKPRALLKHCEVVGGVWVHLAQYQPAMMAWLALESFGTRYWSVAIQLQGL